MEVIQFTSFSTWSTIIGGVSSPQMTQSCITLACLAREKKMSLDKMNLVKPLINSQKTKFVHIIHAVTKSIRSDMLAQVFFFLQLCTIYSLELKL